MAKYVGAHDARVYSILNARCFAQYLVEHQFQLMYCVGADLSMSGTGFVCCTQNNEVELVKTFSSKVVPYTRSSIALFLNDLHKLVHSFCSNIRLMDLPLTDGARRDRVLLVYEEVNVGSNFSGMLGVARAQAASLVGWASGMGAMGEHDVLAIPVSNLQIKKVLGGNQKSTKEDLMACALENYGHEFKDDNQADAFGAALIGIAVILLAEEIASSGLEPEMDPKELREGLKAISEDWHSNLYEVAESLLAKPKFFSNMGLRKINDQIRKEFVHIRDGETGSKKGRDKHG